MSNSETKVRIYHKHDFAIVQVASRHKPLLAFGARSLAFMASLRNVRATGLLDKVRLRALMSGITVGQGLG